MSRIVISSLPASTSVREQLLVQLVAGLGVDLAGLEVDHVLGEVMAVEVLVGDLERLEALLGELPGAPRAVILRPASSTTSPVSASIRSLTALKPRMRSASNGSRQPSLVARVGDLVVEGVEDLLAVHAERIEQRGHRNLAAAVDARVDDVLGVELDVEPRAAIGDDAGGEQQLARRMGLALVVVEEDARRAVHLRDDDALGAVDDEGAVHRHERHLAHVDFLLLDVLDRLGAGLLVDVEHDQAQRHLERRREGHAALAALVDVVFRRLEVVAHELEQRRVGEVGDREDGLEHRLQALVGPPAVRLVDQQELVVGRLLNLDEVRHLGHFLDGAEESADPSATGERLGHVHSSSDVCRNSCPEHRAPYAGRHSGQRSATLRLRARKTPAEPAPPLSSVRRRPATRILRRSGATLAPADRRRGTLPHALTSGPPWRRRLRAAP